MNDEDWMNEPVPEEVLSGNPFPDGGYQAKQWRMGMTTRWRLEKRFPPTSQKRDSTLPKSGGALGSAPNADAYPAKSDEK